MGRLVKAGVIPQQYARRFSLISAWAELVGYVGSITLCALRIATALEREAALTEELHRRKKVRALGRLSKRMNMEGPVCRQSHNLLSTSHIRVAPWTGGVGKQSMVIQEK